MYKTNRSEEQKFLKDEDSEKMTNEKILQLLDVVVGILEREN